MKIAVDLLSIREDGSAGGATGFAIELIKGLSEEVGLEILVICADYNENYLKALLSNKVEYLLINKKTIFDKIIALKNRILSKYTIVSSRKKMLKEKGVDLLYCPFSAPTLKEEGIPTVSTILDIQHEYYPQFFTPQELEHRRKFYNAIVDKVERVVCISNYTKDTFCEKYNYPKSKAETVYIAIQNRFNKEDKDILKKLKLEDKKYIVYPANFWEHKNHKMLLNAFSMYCYARKDLTLVLTGNPLSEKEYYENLIDKLGIKDNIIITGYITNEELYGILKNAKGLIYPSLFEGFGIPLVEAMYLNKLIASSNLTSLPEIGCDDIFYFNPKKPDEILSGIQFLSDQVLEEDNLIYKDVLKKYELDNMVKSYQTIFLKTIKEGVSKEYSTGVEGIYEDGWSSKVIYITINEENSGKLSIKGNNPSFCNNTKVYILYNNHKEVVKLEKGNDFFYTIEVKGAISCEIIIDKVWCPANKHKSNDMRKLGIQVQEILFSTENGEKKIY